MTTQATTIGGTGTRPRPSLEELVDRLMAAMFRAEPETAPQAETPSVDAAKTETKEARWAYAEWTDLVKRRFGHRDELLVYSQGAGRAAALTSRGGGPGDALAGGQAGLAAQPAGSEASGGRRVMVVANGTVDLVALKARHPLGDAVEAAGVRLRGRGRVRQGVCPFHDEVEGSCAPRHAA